MSTKNMEMMKKLLEERKQKNDKNNQMRADKKIGSNSTKKSNKKIGVNKV